VNSTARSASGSLGDGDHAIHAGVPTRFEHQHPAEVIEALAGVASLVEDRRAGEHGIALLDNPDRFAGGMQVDDTNAGRRRHQRSSPVRPTADR
jgi:hypothetical protein